MREVPWQVPEPVSTIRVPLDDGGGAIVRRHGNGSGPRLVLSHGNGLAIDLYLPFWSQLLDDFDVFLYDLRNHGWNGLGPLGSHNIPAFVRDQSRVLEAVDQNFGAAPKIGVFHSLSALISLLSLSPVLSSAEASANRFETLVLFDPPVFRPGMSERLFDERVERVAQHARKRQWRFESLDEFVAMLGRSQNHSRVPRSVLELMARTTLRKSADGECFELRCLPGYEAQIIEYTRSYSGLVNFADLPCPVKVLGADPTLPFAYLPTLDLADMEVIEYDFLPGATHFLQLEQPSKCVATVREYLAKAL